MSRVLIVDNSPSMRQMVKFTIAGSSNEVVEATQGEDALIQAKRDQFDLIISEINMPKMGGIEMIKLLRQLPNYKMTPILILTTESSAAMKDSARLAGANGWITKPFDPDRLVETIRQVIG